VTRRLVVAAAIVDDLARPTRLLAARRSRPAALAGRWEFPGGKLDDADPSPLAALHRELREELGVEVEVGTEVTGPDDGAWILTDAYTMRLWWARLVSGTPAPLVEHDELRWLPVARWGDVPWLDSDVRIVEHLVRAVR